MSSYITGVSKLWSKGQVQVPASHKLNKILLEHSHGHLFTQFVTASELKWQSWLVSIENKWSTKPETVVIWPCIEKSLFTLDIRIRNSPILLAKPTRVFSPIQTHFSYFLIILRLELPLNTLCFLLVGSDLLQFITC